MIHRACARRPGCRQPTGLPAGQSGGRTVSTARVPDRRNVGARAGPKGSRARHPRARHRTVSAFVRHGGPDRRRRPSSPAACRRRWREVRLWSQRWPARTLHSSRSFRWLSDWTNLLRSRAMPRSNCSRQSDVERYAALRDLKSRYDRDGSRHVGLHVRRQALRLDECLIRRKSKPLASRNDQRVLRRELKAAFDPRPVRLRDVDRPERIP